MKRDHFRLSGGTNAEDSVTNMRSDSQDFGYPVEIRSLATYLLAFAAVVTLAGWQCLPATSQEEAAERAPVKALAFLSGHWRGELDGAVTDDFWSEPEGNSIIGMYREIQAGKVTMYELLSIEPTGNGPVLLIKHFNPGLRAWEEKNHGVTLNLTRMMAGEAVFQRPDGRLRLTLRLVSKDVLETTLEEIRNGKPTTTVFREKRSEAERMCKSAGHCLASSTMDPCDLIPRWSHRAPLIKIAVPRDPHLVAMPIYFTVMRSSTSGYTETLRLSTYSA